MNLKNKGITLPELAIVLILAGVLGLGAYNFFKNAFKVWWTTRDSVDVHEDSRTAVNEMSKYIRQASTQPITIGGSNDSVAFEIGKTTTEWHEDLTIKYFKDGSALKRFMKGSTTTLVSSGVELFYVWFDSGTSSSYAFIGSSLSVTQGDETANLNKTIMLRGRR
jgi:hypothetical protein